MNKLFKIKFQKGFTLVEIMVVLALFAILGGILLDTNFSSRKRINALSLDNDSVALEIRDMQNRTLSFIESGENIGYGVYFDLNSPNFIRTFYKTNNTSFVSSDIPSAASKNPTDDLIFQLGNKINRICLNGGTTNCVTQNSTTNTFNKLALFFVKPKQYGNFYIGEYSSGDTYRNYLKPATEEIPINQVCIEMYTGQGNEYRNVTVNYVGQISTAAGQCK